MKLRQPVVSFTCDAGLIPAMGEFNLGESEHNFRVPDGGVLQLGAAGTWLATAALVVEIVSPNDDETWDKLPSMPTTTSTITG